MASAELEAELEHFMQGLEKRNPSEPEFHQAVREIAESVMPFVLDNPDWHKAQILERITEPDRIIIFRVTWEDDSGNIRANRAWRVQFNNSIGAYKGGLRFHPSVNQSILKFLGFEQTFKNALTGLPMGGAKGGANFNPKGKSDREVMRFCHSLMTELQHHIGEVVDVPAGDIGVGEREISYMFGQYKRITNRYVGVLTGKSLTMGGALVRKEATGYGVAYFLREMLASRDDDIAGKTCTVSGSGNVAIYAVEKLTELGAHVVSMSDSGGTVYDPAGIDAAKLAWIKDLKEARRGRISEYAAEFGCEFRAETRPWSIPCDFAVPCATQNELEADDADKLVANGCRAVVEGANMPTTYPALVRLRAAGVPLAPGKAANAGGVGVSGLEQAQNALRIPWKRAEVDSMLQEIMSNIHTECVEWGNEPDGSIDYVHGANRSAFHKVGTAMLAYGVV